MMMQNMTMIRRKTQRSGKGKGCEEDGALEWDLLTDKCIDDNIEEVLFCKSHHR